MDMSPGSRAGSQPSSPCGCEGSRAAWSACLSVSTPTTPGTPFPAARLLRRDHRDDAELRALLETPFRLGGRPQTPREAELPERGDTLAERRRARGGRDRECNGEIGARLVDAHAAGDVDEHVGRPERDPRVATEDGNDHREPLRVDTGSDAAGHREIGSRDERLDLEQDGPRPLESDRNGRADLAGLRPPEERRGVGNANEPCAGHLEHPELVGRAEPVLGRAQDPVGVVAVALELEHAVDEMLEHTRACDGAVLRHVTDEHGRDAASLRDAQQARGRLAHLGDRARRRAELTGIERLHGVDHADVGRLLLEGRADGLQLRLGEDRHVVGAAEALCPQAHLGDRLLAGDEKGLPPAPRDCTEGGEQQRRLADARLPAEEHERGGHEAPAEDAVELRHARREPRCILETNVAEALRGPTRPGPRLTVSSVQLLDEGSERAAAGALPEPAARRRSALATAELDDDLGHATIVREASDATTSMLTTRRARLPARTAPILRM